MKIFAIRTKRLMIRPYLETDFELWREGYLGRLPARNRFDQGQVDLSRIEKPAFRRVLKLHKKAREADRLYVFGVFDRKTKEHVGFLDLYVLARLNFQWANIGYVIHNQFWGRGYAKEASRALALFAFKKLKLHRLEAAIEPDNKPSIAVARAIGMKPEGVRRKFAHDNGAWEDLRLFVLLPEDMGLKSQRPSVGTSLREIL